MDEAMPISTPMHAYITLSTIDGELFDNPTFYKSIVGALWYVTIIRPNLTFDVNKISQ